MGLGLLAYLRCGGTEKRRKEGRAGQRRAEGKGLVAKLENFVRFETPKPHLQHGKPPVEILYPIPTTSISRDGRGRAEAENPGPRTPPWPWHWHWHWPRPRPRRGHLLPPGAWSGAPSDVKWARGPQASHMSKWHPGDSKRFLVLFLWRFKLVMCLNHVICAITARLLGLREISITWEPAPHSHSK
jgi:hypothetical protein